MLRPNAETTESMIVIVTDDGFLDDSVRGDSHKFELSINEHGAWKFVSAGANRLNYSKGCGSGSYAR